MVQALSRRLYMHRKAVASILLRISALIFLIYIVLQLELGSIIMFVSVMAVVYALYKLFPRSFGYEVNYILTLIRKNKYGKAMPRIERLSDRGLNRLPVYRRKELISTVEFLRGHCLCEEGYCSCKYELLEKSISHLTVYIDFYRNIPRKNGNRWLERYYQQSLCDLIDTYYRLMEVEREEYYSDLLISTYDRLSANHRGVETVRIFAELNKKLAWALEIQYSYTRNIENLHRALNAYQESERVYFNLREQKELYSVKIMTGRMFRILFQTAGGDNFRNWAITAIKEALRYFNNYLPKLSLKYFPQEYAWVNYYLGQCYSELAEFEYSEVNLQSSRKYFDESVKGFAEIKYERMIEEALNYEKIFKRGYPCAASARTMQEG